MTRPNVPRLEVGDTVDIHQCDNCGRIEGDKTAPCCPGCGTKDDPRPVTVQVIDPYEEGTT